MSKTGAGCRHVQICAEAGRPRGSDVNGVAGKCLSVNRLAQGCPMMHTLELPPAAEPA